MASQRTPPSPEAECGCPGGGLGLAQRAGSRLGAEEPGAGALWWRPVPGCGSLSSARQREWAWFVQVPTVLLSLATQNNLFSGWRMNSLASSLSSWGDMRFGCHVTRRQHLWPRDRIVSVAPPRWPWPPQKLPGSLSCSLSFPEGRPAGRAPQSLTKAMKTIDQLHYWQLSAK